MNRIILIGNGFDLAHDLKTSYRNFIDDYWARKAKHCTEKQFFKDEEGYIDFSSKYREPINCNVKPELSECCNYTTFESFVKENNANIKFNNRFLKEITTRCGLQNWVDIEKEFYCALKECLNDENQVKIDELNKDFEKIKSLLRNYINEISHAFINSMLSKKEILDEILSQFRYREFSQSYKNILIKDLLEKVNPRFEYEKEDITYKSIIYYFNNIHKIENVSEIKRKDLEVILNDTCKAPSIIKELSLKNILFLNFNYTNTSTIYVDKIVSRHSPKYQVKEINIHGTLNDPDNPIIFGYGDEIDEDYSKIENLDDNRYLENIKSTRYHETDNYKRLLEYIDSDYFQIFIFGHSCGLSDRTLLSTLFNHQNCVSIKPFYHKKEDGTDNYSDIVKNISRHFNNKASLRDKVVNKTYCEPLRGSK